MKANWSPLGSLGLAGAAPASCRTGLTSGPRCQGTALLPRSCATICHADVVVFASSCPRPVNQATVSKQKVVLFLLKTCRPIHSFAFSSFVTIYWSPSLCFCYALNFAPPTTATQLLH